MLKIGSLFTGIGGFDLAAEQLGMKVKWQAEIDTSCLSLLEKHFPDTERINDVKKINNKTASRVEIICGGFPCQDVSIAGKGAGLAGERSGLWFEFARILTEFRPKWAVVENVPGLLSSNQGRDFATILNQMENIGYGVAWRVFDAQYFGVAQRRRRLFIIGSLGDNSCSEVLFESEGICWNPPARGLKGESVAETFTVRTGKSGGGKGYLGIIDKAMPIMGQPQYLAYENHPNDSRITETGEISQQLTSRMGTGGNNVPLVQEYWDGGQVSDTLDVSMLVKGQMMPEKRRFPVILETPVAIGHSGGITIKENKKVNSITTQVGSETTAMFNGCMDRHGIRKLTPLECERLQGFEDYWTDGFSDTTRYKMLGNAVAVPVVRWLLNRIQEIENA